MLALYLTLIDDDNDRDKFELIYITYRKRMVEQAYSVLKNTEDAEDCVHDTFIKIARNMKSIDEPSSDRTLSYVLKAVKNTAINMKQRNDKISSFEEINTKEKLTDNQFFEKLDITENYKLVVNAILSLKDTYRDVMFYHFVSEMKISEIADLLGRKRSTVHQQLVRGKKSLIELLENDLRDWYGKKQRIIYKGFYGSRILW